MPGSSLAVSRYALVGDGFLSKIGTIGSLALSAVPGGGVLTGVTRLALAKGAATGLAAKKGGAGAPLPGARTTMDRIREAIPNIDPTKARNVALGVAGSAAAGAAALGLAPVAGSLAARALTTLGIGTSGSAARAMGLHRRHRRMNTLNPKALRRATRRLAGFHHFAVSTERELRRLAPQHHHAAAHGRRK